MAFLATRRRVKTFAAGWQANSFGQVSLLLRSGGRAAHVIDLPRNDPQINHSSLRRFADFVEWFARLLE